MLDSPALREYALEFLPAGESLLSSELGAQGESSREDFTPFTAAACKDCPAGIGALASPEAVLVLPLTVTDSDSNFHVLIAT